MNYLGRPMNMSFKNILVLILGALALIAMSRDVYEFLKIYTYPELVRNTIMASETRFPKLTMRDLTNEERQFAIHDAWHAYCVRQVDVECMQSSIKARDKFPDPMHIWEMDMILYTLAGFGTNGVLEALPKRSDRNAYTQATLDMWRSYTSNEDHDFTKETIMLPGMLAPVRAIDFLKRRATNSILRSNA